MRLKSCPRRRPFLLQHPNACAWYLGTTNMVSAVGTHCQRERLSIRPSFGLTRLIAGNNGASLFPVHNGSNTSIAVLTYTKCSFSSKAKSWDSQPSQAAWGNSRRLCQWPTATSRSRGRSSLKVAFRPRRNKTSAVPYRGAAHVPTNARTRCPLASSQTACQAQALGPRMAIVYRCGEPLPFDRPG